jgi:hypothetical protein
MWRNTYRDVKEDEPNIKARVETGKSIRGCEMHDLHGYGLTLHKEKKQPSGFFTKLARWIKGK